MLSRKKFPKRKMKVRTAQIDDTGKEKKNIVEREPVTITKSDTPDGKVK
jgi:hypothetical protein